VRVGSCFAGIGGFDLGLEAAGFTSVWQIELEAYQRSILARHWPDVSRYGDITGVRGGNLESVDVICGGFPCQDISIAGKQEGLEGDRSRLWFEMLRVVREVGPRWVLVENSPALRARGADEVLGGLEALNYTCWPLVVGAHHVGAPHRRDRVWIVGYSGESGHKREEHSVSPRRVIADLAGDLAHAGIQRSQGNGLERVRHAERPAQGSDVNGRDRKVARLPRRWPVGPLEPPGADEPSRTVERKMGSDAYGFSNRLAERRRKREIEALGAAVVPQIPEAIGRAILAVERALSGVGQDLAELLG